MSNENNKMQVDIDNLFKQNVNDLSAIKELYRKLKEVEEKFSQIKYIDITLANRLKKDYEKLKRLILDENAQATLSNDIETVKTKLTNDIKTIESQLTDDIETINSQLTDDIEIINSQLDTIETKVETLEKEVDIGCVLRPTTDLANPWILFQDDAHESKGITSISYNSDGTIQLTFDKTYKKIKAFNAFNDEMMKMYGLEAGASTGLNTAKLFLISKLQVGITLTFNQSTEDITISSGGGHIESVNWTSGVGAVIKFKNVPMQSPKSVQVMVSNALFLHSTCSITGNREITVKFYKPTGELVSDISGNWSCMINANFSGLVDFNATSVYDENILSSMALMYSATMKQ